jgi:hypothetical protein
MPLVASPLIGSPISSPVQGSGVDSGIELQLVITQQPSAAATSGVSLVQQPIVTANQGALPDINFTGLVTATVNQVSGGPTTIAGNTKAAVAGVAAFAGLTLTTAGVVTLTFSAPGTKPVTSIQITVT